MIKIFQQKRLAAGGATINAAVNALLGGVAIEGRNDWSRGGRSIYFRDPDRHLLELATPGLWSVYATNYFPCLTLGRVFGFHSLAHLWHQA